MARWRAEAIKRLPELRGVIASAPSVMALWIELHSLFEKAHDHPRNDELIGWIYDYAQWCTQAPRHVDAACDPLTAAAVGFYEHIPRLPAAREDMPRWFQYSEIASSKEIFSYHIGDEAFQELLTHMVRNKDRYRQRPDRQVMPGSPAQPRLDRQADTDHR